MKETIFSGVFGNFFLVLLFLGVFIAPSRVGATPPLVEKIVFESYRDMTLIPGTQTIASEIYSMNPDGTQQTRLTNDNYVDRSPSFSPDGSKIVYYSIIDGDSDGDIYVMAVDGSNSTKLTLNSSFEYDPVWSPDGSKIAFISDRDATPQLDRREIYLMNADGSNQQRLTFSEMGIQGLVYNHDVSWSPDSTKIAFTSNRGGENEDIYVMNADGTDLEALTTDIASDNLPSWSPDGTKILFFSERDWNSYQSGKVYIMNSDGSDQHILNPALSGVASRLSWSPSGMKIVYWSGFVMTMDADGTNVVGLPTDYQFHDGVNPTWGVSWSHIAPVKVWVGLKNSDAVGVKFDLLAEIYKNGTELVASGQLNKISGGAGFNNARLHSIPLPPIGDQDWPVGTNLSIKLYVRNTCFGNTHNSGVARLWFDDASANSRFEATTGVSTADYYLRNNFGLSTQVGSGPRQKIDVQAGSPCSEFKPFGTWVTTL